MNVLQPLLDKTVEVTAQLESLHKVISGCQSFVESTQLLPCPSCARDSKNGEPKLIAVPATINAPNAHGVAVACNQCGLQTAPEYWHLTEPDTSCYAAIYDVYEAWGFTDKTDKAANK